MIIAEGHPESDAKHLRACSAWDHQENPHTLVHVFLVPG